MLSGDLALLTAAAFAGAAVYVSLVEHPARQGLDVRAQLVQWKPAYQRGAIMQASLAIVSGAFGILAFVFTFDWRWILGAALILAPWPYTLFIIMPTNNQLKATAPEAADDTTRGLLAQWGRLHAVRTLLGIGATAAFLWAAN